MAHKIIALGRQFGSGGREIAKKLSTSLGIPCYDRELITLAAQRADLKEELLAPKDEKTANPWLYTAVYDGNAEVPRGQPAEDILFEMQSRVIRDIACREDCIIVGRCADFVLQTEPVEVLSLFVYASLDWRVQRRMKLDHLNEKSAAALVTKIDKQRRKYYDHYTKESWGNPEHYDLCLNSARLGIEQAVALLAAYWRSGNFPRK